MPYEQKVNIMQFNIQSYIGVGPVKLGMNKNKVIEALGRDFNYVPGKSTDPNFPAMYYRGLGLMVFFKRPGVVDGVEFFKKSDLQLDGIRLFELAYTELKELLLDRDIDLEIESYAELTSYKLGVAVYAPDADEEPELPVATILIFERGYYDD